MERIAEASKRRLECRAESSARKRGTDGRDPSASRRFVEKKKRKRKEFAAKVGIRDRGFHRKPYLVALSASIRDLSFIAIPFDRREMKKPERTRSSSVILPARAGSSFLLVFLIVEKFLRGKPGDGPMRIASGDSHALYYSGLLLELS